MKKQKFNLFKVLVKVIEFPFKILAYIMIHFYKIIISPLLPKSCNYVPTCSTYALLAIKKFGIVKGVFLTGKRLLRCNPNHKGGYDPVPDNIKGDIKWLI